MSENLSKVKEILKSKLDDEIDIDYLIKRLGKELNTEKENLYEIVLDVVIIILDYTNQGKMKFLQSTMLLNMIKDYYSLKGYDKLDFEEGNKDNSNIKVKSISVGDTTTTFVDEQSQITINGITYNSGTIEFDKNILLEKYAEELNRHRKIRW